MLLKAYLFCFVLMVVIIGRLSDVSVCFVVQDSRLYIVLYTVAISGEDVCCSVVFGIMLCDLSG